MLWHCKDVPKVGQSIESDCKNLSRWASLALAGRLQVTLAKLPVFLPNHFSPDCQLDWSLKASGIASLLGPVVQGKLLLVETQKGL